MIFCKGLSFGIIVNYLVAYLLQPYEKSKIAKAYEQSKISKDLFEQLQGITNQRTKKKNTNLVACRVFNAGR